MMEKYAIRPAGAPIAGRGGYGATPAAGYAAKPRSGDDGEA